MPPLNDDELRGLLREWRAPLTPASLENRIMMAANPWFIRCLRWLATGSIRVPAPVCIVVFVLMLALAFEALQAPKPPAGNCIAWVGSNCAAGAKERHS